jgi:hypothetical protein
MAVVGFLISRGPADTPQLLAAFRQGLKDAGFIEGQNVAIEYRFADNQNERLPALAADLVQRQVVLIVATGGTARDSPPRRLRRPFRSSLLLAMIRSGWVRSPASIGREDDSASRDG